MLSSNEFDPEWILAIKGLANEFQTRYSVDSQTVRDKLPGWTFQGDEIEDWEIFADFGGSFRITLWFDCPKRLRLSLLDRAKREYVNASWLWSNRAEKYRCCACRETKQVAALKEVVASMNETFNAQYE